MGLFKSKEQRNKEKLKKELKGKIAAIGQGGGRSKQAGKKRLQRELKAVDAPKKEEKPKSGLSKAQLNKRKNYGNNQSGSGNQSKSNSSSKTVTKDKFGRKLSPYQMKQAERKAATQQKAKNKTADWKKMRAGTMSKEEFIKKYPRSQTARKYGKK